MDGERGVDRLTERRGKAVALLRPYAPALVAVAAVLVMLWSAGAVISAVRTQRTDSRLQHAIDVSGATLDERSADAEQRAQLVWKTSHILIPNKCSA